jgi:hypothetical protein
MRRLLAANPIRTRRWLLLQLTRTKTDHRYQFPAENIIHDAIMFSNLVFIVHLCKIFFNFL